MDQTRNLPDRTGQANTYSAVDFFKANKANLTLQQYVSENITSQELQLSGARLARYYIGVSLQHIYQVIGLRPENEPTKELAVTIARYIQKTFFYFTPDDLYQAFEFALQDKYRCGKEHLEHYQVMDIKYLTRVFSTYAKYRREMINKAEEKSELDKLKEHRSWIIESRPMNDKAVKDSLIEAFNLVCKGESAKLNIRNNYLEWLIDIGSIHVSKERYDELIHDQLKHTNGTTTYFTVRSSVDKHIVITKLQEWDIKGTNPMEELFELVCFLSPDDTMELLKLQIQENNLTNE